MWASREPITGLPRKCINLKWDPCDEAGRQWKRVSRGIDCGCGGCLCGMHTDDIGLQEGAWLTDEDGRCRVVAEEYVPSECSVLGATTTASDARGQRCVAREERRIDNHRVHVRVGEEFQANVPVWDDGIDAADSLADAPDTRVSSSDKVV